MKRTHFFPGIKIDGDRESAAPAPTCRYCGKSECLCAPDPRERAESAAPAPADGLVWAQHDETGRHWHGKRSELPPRYAEIPLLSRIEAARKRIEDGWAPRRIPADPSDVDLVLADCAAAIAQTKEGT